MWSWFRNHRRKKILETPFPSEWKIFLQKNVIHYSRLDQSQRKQLHELIQVFITEKYWEGCGGLVLNDEIRVTIAAQACLMILALPHDLYHDVDSILIYPNAVLSPERPVGIFEKPGRIMSGETPIVGQAHLHGPVILVWDTVLHAARHPGNGHNVVYHEFAHKLDMSDGSANGAPSFESREQAQRWFEICSQEFTTLQSLTQKGQSSFLDSYGAVNEAEFFAVITEQFFDQPVQMKKNHSTLYEILCDFYRQDPAAFELHTGLLIRSR